MFKVWGGGIYELDEFYEIADELGILIWQVNCRNMIEGSRSWQPFLREQKFTCKQGGIICGAIDEPRKSSKAIDKHMIINFRDKNVAIARFRYSILSIAILIYR